MTYFFSMKMLAFLLIAGLGIAGVTLFGARSLQGDIGSPVTCYACAEGQCSATVVPYDSSIGYLPCNQYSDTYFDTMADCFELCEDISPAPKKQDPIPASQAPASKAPVPMQSGYCCRNAQCTQSNSRQECDGRWFDTLKECYKGCTY